MEELKLIDKLQKKANISYEEAKDILEKSNWDILDAILYLEENNKIKKPSSSIFYTNESKENYKYLERINNNKKNTFNKDVNSFEGIFEVLCKVIDTCNNIFLEIKKDNIVFLKIPLTVVILLLIFTFWMVIPLSIVGLFFDIEFSLKSSKIEVNKANDILKKISKNIKRIKAELKRGSKNG